MKNITLTKGQVAIVDDNLFEELSKYKWCAGEYHKMGLVYYYAKRGFRINGKSIVVLMHTQILGESNVGLIIDHKDGNTLNNTVSNLRYATRSQNNQNRFKSVNCLSKYKGVTFYKGAFVAQLKFNKKNRYLGRFKSEISAALAYNKEAIKVFGEFAKINII